MYILSDIWQSMGYSSIIYLATLSGVDVEQYEAAYIDGANRFQRIVHITIPALIPTATILLILSSSRIINVGFEKVYLMQNPAIYETADVIQTYVYRRGIQAANFSYASAVGFFNSLVSFAIVMAANKVSRSLNQNGIW
jgi:putative aldouronate transport system permease protein